MHQKKQWKGLKSIGMEKKTIRKGGTEKEGYRYYISSLCEDIELFSRAVRDIVQWKACIGIWM